MGAILFTVTELFNEKYHVQFADFFQSHVDYSESNNGALFRFYDIL